MSWKNTKSFIGTLLASLFLTSAVIADGGKGRYEEKLGYDVDWTTIMMLFSPRFEKEPYLSNLDVHSVVAVDTFSDSGSVWNWLYRDAETFTPNEPWLHATYIDSDIVPVAQKYNVQEFFDAIIMVRSNTFWDMYDLLEKGWILGNMRQEVFDQSSTVDEPGNYFDPRNFSREQNGRNYDGIYVNNAVYRISTEHAYVFSFGDGID